MGCLDKPTLKTVRVEKPREMPLNRTNYFQEFRVACYEYYYFAKTNELKEAKWAKAQLGSKSGRELSEEYQGLLSSIEARDERNNKKTLMDMSHKNFEIIFKMDKKKIADYATDFKKRAEADAMADDAFGEKQSQ